MAPGQIDDRRVKFHVELCDALLELLKLLWHFLLIVAVLVLHVEVDELLLNLRHDLETLGLERLLRLQHPVVIYKTIRVVRDLLMGVCLGGSGFLSSWVG